MCVGVGVPVEEPVLVLRNALRLAALRPSISYISPKNFVKNLSIYIIEVKTFTKQYSNNETTSYSDYNWFQRMIHSFL